MLHPPLPLPVYFGYTFHTDWLACHIFLYFEFHNLFVFMFLCSKKGVLIHYLAPSVSWQQLLPWLACHAVPDWLYLGLIVPNVGPSVRLIVPNEQFVPNDISDWTPTPMDSFWPRRYQSGWCYCQKHFSIFEAFMIWYTHHGWKKLEGNHFQKHLGKISFALPGFDQNLQLRCLWYCDTRRQWQAFKNIFDVIASLIGSSLCIFEINCLVVFWSGGPPEQTGDKSHKTTMSGSQESFRVPASHFGAGKTPKDNI